MTAIAGAHIDDRERVKDCLSKIAGASRHLLSLINDILDLSKIESGNITLSEDSFSISELLDDMINMLSPQMKSKDLQFKFRIEQVKHEKVIGDPLKLQQVFTNILSNAIKYTPNGGSVTVDFNEKPTNSARIAEYEFICQDTGYGMSEEYLSKLFEPFERASDDRIKNIQGTGLGMVITRNIVRMMDGDITVESRLDEGSRFTVTFRMKLQDDECLYDEKLARLKVLVVDDDPSVCESTCMAVEELGMTADYALTGEAAVEAVLAHTFSNTAYDLSDIEQEAIASGANAVISKPLFRSKLAKMFQSFVSQEEETPDEEPFYELETLGFAGHRALLVEDNELNAEIAAEILEMTGMEVVHAWDGVEAIDRMTGCEDGYFDIIFMDIQMPVMNGYDAARAIRAMNRNYCKKIPIVAMTANAFAEDVLAAKTVGMNEHIAKPLDLKNLARTLNRWLR